MEIFAAKQEGSYGAVRAVNIERLVEPPAPLDEGEQRVNAAPDDHDIQRIAVGIAGFVGSATGQLPQLLHAAWRYRRLLPFRLHKYFRKSTFSIAVIEPTDRWRELNWSACCLFGFEPDLE